MINNNSDISKLLNIIHSKLQLSKNNININEQRHVGKKYIPTPQKLCNIYMNDNTIIKEQNFTSNIWNQQIHIDTCQVEEKLFNFESTNNPNNINKNKLSFASKKQRNIRKRTKRTITISDTIKLESVTLSNIDTITKIENNNELDYFTAWRNSEKYLKINHCFLLVTDATIVTKHLHINKEMSNILRDDILSEAKTMLSGGTIHEKIAHKYIAEIINNEVEKYHNGKETKLIINILYEWNPSLYDNDIPVPKNENEKPSSLNRFEESYHQHNDYLLCIITYPGLIYSSLTWNELKEIDFKEVKRILDDLRQRGLMDMEKNLYFLLESNSIKTKKL